MHFMRQFQRLISFALVLSFLLVGAPTKARADNPAAGKVGSEIAKLFNGDVNPTNQAIGQSLIWNGTSWVSGSPGAGAFPLLAPNGSAAAPSYAFSGHAGDGMFSTGAGNLSWATGGVSQMTLSSTGYLVIQGNITAQAGVAALVNVSLNSTGSYSWSTRSTVSSPADGNVLLQNNAGASFGLLQLGGTTNAFAAIKRNGAAINFRLADDSADAAITAAGITASGQILANGGSAAAPGIGWSADAGSGFRQRGAISSFDLVLGGVSRITYATTSMNMGSMPLAFAAGDPSINSPYAGISATGADTIAIGNGTQGDASGTLKAGSLVLGNGSGSAPSLSFAFASNTGIWSGGGGILDFALGGANTARLTSASFKFSNVTSLGWVSSGDPTTGTQDVFLSRRGAAGTIGVSNGVNPCALQIYNTTDADTGAPVANHERLSVGWAGNVCTIQPQAGGTGAGRALVVAAGASSPLQFGSGGLTNIVSINGTGIANFDYRGPLAITMATPLTAALPILSLAPIWNNAAVAFTGIVENITDTASAASSLLMDLQLGGVSKFSVRKDGIVLNATIDASLASNAPIVKLNQSSTIPANPTGTTSVGGVMAGLAVAFTPRSSGRLLVVVTVGAATNNTSGAVADAEIRYGTGTAPVNGAALVGTIAGSFARATIPTINGNASMTASAIVTGLSVGTTYWLDLREAAASGGTSTLQNITYNVIEL